MRQPQGKRAGREQIVALQTLYSIWAAHTIQTHSDARTARLNWASESIGREVDSFSDLTRDEARHLIDTLKGAMGQQLTEQPRPWRQIRSRDRAQAAGTAGRRGKKSSLIQLAGPDDHARIGEALTRLGWDRGRYEAWLRSDSSPVGCGDSPSIRTVAEANKVWWALKAMLKRSGRWYPEPERTNERNSLCR
jgi:hypothetical protein